MYIKEFCDLRDRLVENNPNIIITILKNSIMTDDGKEKVFYLIDSENNHIVRAETIETVETFLPEKDVANKIADSSNSQFQQGKTQQKLDLGEI